MTVQSTVASASRIMSLALASMLVGGCDDIAGKTPPPPPPPPVVEFVTVEQRDVPIYREWIGTLMGEVNATISAQVSGYLLRREYDEGKLVKQGQVLFQIDPAPFDAALAQAKAVLEQSRAYKTKTALDVERYRPLAAAEAISKQELDNAIQADKAADAEIEKNLASVKEAELNLQFTTIRSPVDGVAGLAQAQVGNLIGPSTGALTTVSQIEPIRAYFSVSQELMTAIQERTLAEGRELRSGQGPQLELIMASGAVYPHKGAVRFADNQVDMRTGTIRVVGEFPNPQQTLVPGMFVRVRALLDTRKGAMIVPQRAVTDLQGRSLVAVIGSDNKVSIVPVTVDERLSREWVVTGKFKPGDRIVAEGVQKVRDGAVVDPVPFTESPGAATASKGSDEKS